MTTPDLVRKLRDAIASQVFIDTGNNIRSLMREAADLLSRLPVTADGVVVVPGMSVYGTRKNRVVKCVAALDWPRFGHGPGDALYWSECYSSEAACLSAAQAAKEGK